MRSVQIGNIEMCKLLIDNGALPSINTPDKVNICYHKIICVYLFVIYMLVVNYIYDMCLLRMCLIICDVIILLYMLCVLYIYI
jgi:hypothetical protein